LKFLREEYSQNGRDYIDKIIEDDIKGCETSIEEKRKNNIDDIDLNLDLLNIKFMNNLRAALGSSEHKFNRYLENLGTKSVILSLICAMSDADLENRCDEEFLMEKAREDRKRALEIFDEALQDCREAIERDEKYKKGTKEYKNHDYLLRILLKLKERILSLSERPPGMDDAGKTAVEIYMAITEILGDGIGMNIKDGNSTEEDTERDNDIEGDAEEENDTEEDIEEICNAKEDNDMDNGEKNIIRIAIENFRRGKSQKHIEGPNNLLLLEFQYLYDRSLFNFVVDYMLKINKNYPEYFQQLRQLRIQMEFKHRRSLAGNRTSIETEIEFLRLNSMVSNRDIYFKKQLALKFLREENNRNNRGDNGKKNKGAKGAENNRGADRRDDNTNNYVKETLEKKIEESRIILEINDADSLYASINAKYLKSLEKVLNFKDQDFEKYLEDIKIEGAMVAMVLDAENIDRNPPERAADKTHLQSEAEKDKNRVEKIFNRVISLYRQIVDGKRKYGNGAIGGTSNINNIDNNSNDDDNYSIYSKRLKTAIALKSMIFSQDSSVVNFPGISKGCKKVMRNK
jgi:hypothetical protein